MERLYFDWAATARPDSDIIRQSCEKALELFGNPSSSHSEGKEAAVLIRECRESIARRLNVRPEQIIFTSGGTESNNLILFSLLNRRRSPGHLLISGFEHAAVFEPAKALKEMGWKLNTLPPAKDGRISTEKITELLTGETEMVSLMAVNNETGMRLPVARTASLIREAEKGLGRKILLHTDGVQALGKEKIDLKDWNVDAASFSGHKIGAPRGIGFLYLKEPHALLNRGGGQEMGIRGGTENLQGIFGLTLAMEKRYSSLEADRRRAAELKTYLADRLEKKAGARIIHGSKRALSEDFSPWLLMASFPPVPGEVLARVLNDRGAAVSTGSACSARQKKTFRVSDGLGISRDEAFSAIRISWGPETTKEECEALVRVFQSEVEMLRRVTGKKR